MCQPVKTIQHKNAKLWLSTYKITFCASIKTEIHFKRQHVSPCPIWLEHRMDSCYTSICHCYVVVVGTNIGMVYTKCDSVPLGTTLTNVPFFLQKKRDTTSILEHYLQVVTKFI